MKKFVRYVRNLSHGEKNGKRIGIMWFIVVKDVEGIKKYKFKVGNYPIELN